MKTVVLQMKTGATTGTWDDHINIDHHNFNQYDINVVTEETLTLSGPTFQRASFGRGGALSAPPWKIHEGVV